MNILSYTPMIPKQLVESMLNLEANQLSQEQWQLIEKQIIFFEIFLCKLHRRILSRATIEIQVNNEDLEDDINPETYLQNLIIEQKVFGPLLKVTKIENNKIIYEAGAESLESAMGIMVLFFLCELLEGTNTDLTKEQKNEQLMWQINKFTTNVQYLPNFLIIKNGKPILSNESVLALFKDKQFVNKNKDLLFFLRDGMELFVQKYILNYFFFEYEGEILINKDLYIPEIEQYIKKKILHNQLPGPFIEIISKTEKNDFFIIRFRFGNKRTGMDINPISNLIAKCITTLIYSGQHRDFFALIEEFVDRGDYV